MLIDSFLKYKGYTSNKKSGNLPLLPFIMADALYLAHESYIKGRLNQKAKFHANKMMECYHRLNHDFFKAFSQEEQNELVEKMDSFDEYLHNDFEVFRMVVMKPIMHHPVETREIVAGLCIIKLLACHAQYIYSVIYTDSLGREVPDKNLQGIKHHACEMFRHYSAKHGSDNINLNDVPMVQQCCNNISKRILEFIDNWQKKDENKEKAS